MWYYTLTSLEINCLKEIILVVYIDFPCECIGIFFFNFVCIPLLSGSVRIINFIIIPFYRFPSSDNKLRI